MEDVALPGLPCPCMPCQPGWQIWAHTSLSQAWHVLLLLAGRDDSLHKHCNSYFLNENLCFVPIQICWEARKSLCWPWLSHNPQGCRTETATSSPLTSHPFQAQQEHRVHPRDASRDIPSLPPTRGAAFLHGTAGYQLLSCCFGSSSSCHPASLAEHRQEKEISPPHCKLAAGQRNITPWDCNYILLAQASWEASPLPANYRTLYCY